MAGPGGESVSGHPTPYTRLWETQESKLRCTLASPVLVRAGAGPARRGRGRAGDPSAPHSWRALPGTSGQHVAPITVPKACARLFLPTGWQGEGEGGGGRLLWTPAGRRGPGGSGSACGPDSGIQLCPRGALQALLSSLDPSQFVPLFLPEGLTGTHLG